MTTKATSASTDKDEPTNNDRPEDCASFNETVSGAVARLRRVAKTVGVEHLDDLLVAEAMLHRLDGMRNEVALFSAALRGQLSKGEIGRAQGTANELRDYLGQWGGEHLLTVRKATGA